MLQQQQLPEARVLLLFDKAAIHSSLFSSFAYRNNATVTTLTEADPFASQQGI